MRVKVVIEDDSGREMFFWYLTQPVQAGQHVAIEFDVMPQES